MLRAELDVAQADAEAVPERAVAVPVSDDRIRKEGCHAVRVEGVDGEEERVGEARDVVRRSQVLLDGTDRAPDGQSRVGLASGTNGEPVLATPYTVRRSASRTTAP